MSQRSTSFKNVTVTLWGIIEEIDDDDEDILEISIDVSNDSNKDMWDIHGDVRAMDGTHGVNQNIPSRIEANSDGMLTFWIPSKTGAWLFKLDYNTDVGHETIELGPFSDDLRIEIVEKPERSNKSIEESSVSEIVDVATTDDLLAMAFVEALDGFGKEPEGESELMKDVISEDPMQAAFAGGILESRQTIENPTSTTEPLVGAPSGPPSAPPAAPSGPPSGPPSAPPAAPNGPPSGPPSAPPAAPSGPPSGPPSSGAFPSSTSGPPGPPPK